MAWLKRTFKVLTWTFITGFVLIALIVGFAIYHVEQSLPDVSVLNDMKLQVPLRIFTSDGLLLAEYGKKRRKPVPYEQIPKPLIDAILSTEDQRFFEHPGIDIMGLGRAAVQLVSTGRKSQGGSTITMQVARNFFLSSKKTYSRKLKEILLAIKIDNELSKEKILELYLNKIFLGNRAYGVGAAAQIYYGKSLNQLSLAQLAMIAGLPKAPSALNPIRNPVAAKKRRNHVLKRVYEENYISLADYQRATQEPITATYHGLPITVEAPYVSEMARAAMLNEYGEAAYTKGLNVYTTLSSRLQKAANQASRTGLLEYDKRHGYRGRLKNLGQPNPDKLSEWLSALSDISVISELYPAAIIGIEEQSATALLADGHIVILPWNSIVWARKDAKKRYPGPVPKQIEDVLKLGDVVRVEKTGKESWGLSQVPAAQAALIAIAPQTGAIKALTGGFDYDRSNFNRATQAKRQAGSSFKPFIYSAALSKNFTLASIINDAPIVVSDPTEEDLWRPQNDTRQFYGPTRLRTGLIKSRNLVSIRVLKAITIPYATNYLKHFGFDEETLPQSLSLALGTANVTPLELAEGYSVIANGGYKTTPYFIDHITDSNEDIIYKANPEVACESCLQANSTPSNETKEPHYAPHAISPQVAYLMTSALQDVILHGTGRRVKQYGLDRTDLAGKTGTTNDQKDAWFAGFNSDLATVTWVGFDQPRSLYEYGSKAALPIWVDFMKKALKRMPIHSMPQPPGIVSIRIDPETGEHADAWQKNAIFEVFRSDLAPKPKAIAPKQQIYHVNQETNNDNNDDDEDESQLF